MFILDMVQLTCLLATFSILFCCVSSKNITSSKESIYHATSTVSTSTSEPKKINEELQGPIFRRTSLEEAKNPINVDVGEKIRLTCGVRGKPKPVIHFFKNSQPLKTQESSSDLNRIEVTATSIRISKARLEDSGEYRCDATNVIGNRSLTFKVNVSLPLQDAKSDKKSAQTSLAPYWTNERKMKKTLHAEPAGNTVVFRCLANGHQPLTVKWYKGREEILSRAQRIGGYKFRHKNQLIVLESVVLSDRGFYRCVVSNQYGSINHTYELDVTERAVHRPLLHMPPPVNKTVMIGEDVHFQCDVYSDPHPHIRWLKHIEVNGSRFNPENNSPYLLELKKTGVSMSNEDMRTLTLRNVSYKDAGQYTCLAGNAIGISHISAWLTVVPAQPPLQANELINHYQPTQPSPLAAYVAGLISGAYIGLKSSLEFIAQNGTQHF